MEHPSASPRRDLHLLPSVEAVSAAVGALRALAEELEDCTIPDGFLVAVAEAVANIAHHGRGCSHIRLSAQRTDTTFEVTIRDDAVAFDMASAPHELPASPLAESGRGLFLLHSGCDEVRYRREGAENVHELVLRVSSAL